MAYDELVAPAGVGQPFVNGDPWSYQNAQRTHDNFEDHEARITSVEGGALAMLTADPVSPADDTVWFVRDGGSPQSVAIKTRIGGVTYTIAEITI